ncbi:hypothetical protein [Pseudomonas serbica]|jgi:hypothetical protein|uniref:hypothetical protein n=1 Tax=Pseudomonas serbica TaxID=2965074 RepID=UPI00237A56B6|nr:hypothetical protein [Pseudomonas serbica]
MFRTIVVTVTSSKPDNLCGLYQIDGIDPELSVGQVVDIALESLIDFIGLNIMFANYALNVFDPQAKAELTERVAIKSTTSRPCTKVADEVPEWIANILQAKAAAAQA